MRYINITLIAVFGFLFVQCNPGTSERETAESAEETTEEKAGVDLNDEAESIIDVYAYGFMLQDYGELAISKNNLPDTVLNFAQASVLAHKNLNLQIAKMVEDTDITLPLEVGDNVDEFKKDLTALEGEEFVEEYLSTVQEIQSSLEAEVREGFSHTDNNALREFSVSVIPTIEAQQQALERVKEEVSGE